MILEEKKVFAISMTKKVKSLVLVNGKKIEKYLLQDITSYMMKIGMIGSKDTFIKKRSCELFLFLKERDTIKNTMKKTY